MAVGGARLVVIIFFWQHLRRRRETQHTTNPIFFFSQSSFRSQLFFHSQETVMIELRGKKESRSANRNQQQKNIIYIYYGRDPWTGRRAPPTPDTLKITDAEMDGNRNCYGIRHTGTNLGDTPFLLFLAFFSLLFTASADKNICGVTSFPLATPSTRWGLRFLPQPFF